MSFTETADGLLYEEPPWPVRLRLLLTGFGAAFCLFSLPFLLHDASAFGLVAAIFMTAGLGFIALGLVRRQQLRIDVTQRQIVRRRGSRLETLSFDRVRRIDVVRHAGMDGPDVFEVVLRIRGRWPLRLGAFNSRDEAVHWQQRLQTLIG